MDISTSDLLAECQRALNAWPFLWSYEAAVGLPRGLLLAVGSRETNLTNEVGDGGHGHGVWQLDDRSHTIPAGFDQDVQQQAQTAASMLANLLSAYQGDVQKGCAAYNCGQGNVEAGIQQHDNPDWYTAGPNYPNYPGDYGADVLARLNTIQQAYPEDAMTDADWTRMEALFVSLHNDIVEVIHGDKTHPDNEDAIVAKLNAILAAVSK